MQLFNIAGTDLTRFIQAPTYKVNEVPVYDEWTDANKVTHKDVVRTQVKGTFTLFFTDVSDYWDFMNLVNANKGAGEYLLASLFLNNKNTVVSKNIFIDYEPTNNLPFYGVKPYSGFEVSVEER